MKKYCCKELHDLEDDSFQRGFGVNVIEKNRIEIFFMDDDGYPKRIDEYIFNFCPFCGSKLAGLTEYS